MQGKSNKGICRALNLAEPTVKNHVTAILKALKVTNRTEAVISAGRLGWQLPLAGALPAALIALAADGLLGLAERRLAWRGK